MCIGIDIYMNVMYMNGKLLNLNECQNSEILKLDLYNTGIQLEKVF